MEYLKNKINELATNSKSKNIRDLYRGINEFKKGCQLRNNLVKDENGDLLADPHNILNRWKKYFFQLLNVHSVIDVPVVFKLKLPLQSCKYKSPVRVEIPAEFIQAGGKILLSAVWENCLISGKSLLF
jgi:hypothetical protein